MGLSWQSALLLEWACAGRGDQCQQVLLIVREDRCLEEDLDDADQVPEALGLRPLVEIALALLRSPILPQLVEGLGCCAFLLPRLRRYLLWRLLGLFLPLHDLAPSRCHPVVDGIEVVSDQNEVEVVEATEFEESLPPVEPLLDLCLVQLLVVDRDELVDQLEGVEHLVDAVRVDDLRPLHLRHVPQRLARDGMRAYFGRRGVDNVVGGCHLVE